ncbi:choice-of-anchor L domain-containing protein [Halomonas venusta]|uniref:choice-of-anchor L domain-containing protein n=1 Tax=Vreelandella venusta TaxID=44935 RepID=UPI00295F32EF|nr:choice-of-anchor L domain-containing protein [Halomonas venusta]MDW0360249.1 choice-of-anchor L domain-containing protein [Halomonas venusta]
MQLTKFWEGGIATNVTYTGSSNAAFWVDNFEILPEEGFELPAYQYGQGIMLSTGGFPGSENTTTGDSVNHGEPGDSDLTETALEAFPGAGSTNDASVIEFTVNVNDPDVDTLRASLVFGSEEFPEFVDSDYVDIAALYVNGVNYAEFAATDKPLSVISDNLESGVFVDNSDQFSSPYAIESDGFSREIVVRAPLQQGENTIKIGIADTGDLILDSGLFVSDLSLISGGGSGGGVLSALVPDTEGNVTTTVAAEEVTLNEQANIVTGSTAELNGDVIVGFETNDKVVVKDSFFDVSDVTFSLGSVILDIDSNQDGENDTTLTFADLDDPDSFVFTQAEDGTTITLDETSLEPEPEPEPEPVANNDDLAGHFGWLASGNLFADNGNGADQAAGGEALVITAIDGQDVVFNTAMTLDSGASVIVQENGDFTYDQGSAFTALAEGETAIDTFEYLIAGSQGAAASAVVSVGLGEAIDSVEISAIEALYQMAFDREADADGLEYWSGIRDEGSSLFEVADYFLASEEFVSEHGDNLDADDFLMVLYDNAFDRAPDAEGLEYWSEVLVTEQAGQGDVMAYFASSDEMHSKYLAEGFIFA